MGSLEKSPQQVGFGQFELDLRTRELFVNGEKLDLQEQPFLVLSALLERPGELVTRDELTKRLWPADTFVDFEHSLNRVINRLREALEDSAEHPRFVETLPRRGYRFVAPVRPVVPSEIHQADVSEAPTGHDLPGSDSDITGATIAVSSAGGQNAETVLNDVSAQAKANKRFDLLRQRLSIFALALGLGGLAGVFTYWLLFPVPVPHVIRTRQLTTGARIELWAPIVTDGSRIVYLEREGDHWNVEQTSVSGGEPQPMTVPFHNTVVLDISPDRSNYLIANFEHRDDVMPLWTWPVQGGPPRRIGSIVGYMGKWRPDGHSIVYSMQDGVYQAEVDGSNPHKLVSTRGRYATDFDWSPDGRLLRYTVFTESDDGEIWQVQADGSHLQRIPASWARTPSGDCCGRWSTNGEYFYFSSSHLRTGDIWAIREKKDFWHRGLSEPVRLTAFPIYFGQPIPFANQQSLLVLGMTTGRATHLRFDPVRLQFSPLLQNISGWTLDFSRDGKWLVYVSTADTSLIRARTDGSEPQVLAQLKYQANHPLWSPDGKQILFDGTKSDGAKGMLIVPADGGPAKELLPGTQGEPCWSPDGKLIAYDAIDESAAQPNYVSIYILDLPTNKGSMLPGSHGLRNATWSPDGRCIAATDRDHQKVMLFDRESQKWTELATTKLLTEMFWSKDGKMLYYEDLLSPNQPIYRVRMSHRKPELIATFENYLHSGFQRAALIAIAPDGSLISRLDPGGVNIYALDLEMH